MNQTPPPHQQFQCPGLKLSTTGTFCVTLFSPSGCSFRNTTPHDKQNLHQTANYEAKHYLFRYMSTPCMYAQVSSVDP